MLPFYVHPRPTSAPQDPPQPPLPAPSEASFIAEFGALLPPAQYLDTPHGKAAYYHFPPSTSSASTPSDTAPRRVLLIHGVQTPALGLLPLIRILRTVFPGTEFATLDLWGHGLSDSPRQAHTGSLFHSLIDAVLLDLSWDDDEGVHMVGYSFGAVLTMGYITSLSDSSPMSGRIRSYTLIAPAGLLRESWFTPAQHVFLSPSCPPASEKEAADFVIETLEGGPLTVPADWRSTVARGEVSAQAIKVWQIENHPGHPASVVAIFRDGGILENDELFVKARGTGIKALVVLGEEDGLNTESEIKGFGFDVRVVLKAGHGLVRENAGEVAGYIASFWKGL